MKQERIIFLAELLKNLINEHEQTTYQLTYQPFRKIHKTVYQSSH